MTPGEKKGGDENASPRVQRELAEKVGTWVKHGMKMTLRI